MNFPRERIARAFLSALALLPACITATATVAVSPCGTNNIDPTSGVLLTWAADAGALGYRLDINSDPFYSSGSNIHIESVFPPNVSVTVTGLQLSTQYYWHVATQGSDGNWGSYGTPCTFTTFGPQAVPILYSPAHEAVGLNTPTATCSWYASLNATSYEVQWSTLPDFVVFGTVSSTTNSALFNNLAAGQTYFWRVRAFVGTTPGDWGSTWAFFTTSVTTTMNLKVFLQGGLNESTLLMPPPATVPNSQPYSGYGYSPYNSSASIGTFTTGNNAIIDWLILEFRYESTFAVARTWAVLLQRDGDVVMPNGSTSMVFPMGRFRLGVRHRNHLGVMTGTQVIANGTAINLDLTQTSTILYGTSPTYTFATTRRALWAGDCSGNGTVLYTGSNNDRDKILVAVGSTTPNATVSGYRREDVNMDGVVKYTGSGNDRDIILTTVGSTTPNSTRAQQLP